MSTRQQAGRAGRKGGESLAVLVAQANPLDQYFITARINFFPVRMSTLLLIQKIRTLSRGSCFALRQNCRYGRMRTVNFSGIRSFRF